MSSRDNNRCWWLVGCQSVYFVADTVDLNHIEQKSDCCCNVLSRQLVWGHVKLYCKLLRVSKLKQQQRVFWGWGGSNFSESSCINLGKWNCLTTRSEKSKIIFLSNMIWGKRESLGTTTPAQFPSRSLSLQPPNLTLQLDDETIKHFNSYSTLSWLMPAAPSRKRQAVTFLFPPPSCYTKAMEKKCKWRKTT